MCGIVGYLGHQDALRVIVSGLEKLEYRGYDSAGIARLEDGEIKVSRAMGKLEVLKKALGDRLNTGNSNIGIGHTRWATHGKPSENNAHPHTAGRISLIHNGIIENYMELRDVLSKQGRSFNSETDTEIAAHLIDSFVQAGKSPFEALKAACNEIRGSYAFLAIDKENPDRILVAKNATPIVIGFAEGEVIIASDIPAVLEITRDIIILEDGDLAEVMLSSIHIENNGETVERAAQRITWDPVTAQKGGFKHYMMKEIHEQVVVAAETFRGRMNMESAQVTLPELDSFSNTVKDIERIVLIACGTAWHACLLAKYYIEDFAGIPCEVDYASEYRYRRPIFDEKTLIVSISQSGETADTLGAIELVRNVSKTLAVCNVLGSTLTRRVDYTLYTHAGPEISVASTKAFTTQLVAVYLLAMFIGQQRTSIDTERSHKLLDGLLKLPTALDAALQTDSEILEVAKAFHTAKDFLFLGRGTCFPIALEGALKLKEISYIHAEAYPAGEMKHGPLALIDESMPVVVVLQRSTALFEKTLSGLREAHARAGKIIAITDNDNISELTNICDHVIEVPFINEEVSPIVLNIPLQLLAYHVSVLNGTDVDQPRNLAKSVTVE
ncbi:MAG: glutamine--fructose-6-phosphate transaminase (isomerizing) [Bdellovibrionales bacterium]|nr:glutamine--fructose-6-phosphate transaminase (isomerizing) [Bdellovibrionales bacterium]